MKELKEIFDIGFDANPPRVMLVQIPIAKYAADDKDGIDLFYGKMKRVTAVGATLIKQEMVRRKKTNGVINPGGGDFSVA